MHIVLTGGGTAGHVTPNIALIKRLQQEGWEIDYIGSLNGIEKELISAIPGVTYHGVQTGKLRRYLDLKNLSDPFRVIKGCSQARKLIRALKPDVIFSKGGFVSVPVVAAHGKVPVVIHESDYTPGLANRIACRFADTVCVTFQDTMHKVKVRRVVHTGTPIRPELYEGSAERGRAFTGFDGQKPVLLIMGGSSGAQRLNELVREALPKLTAQFDIIHLCGRGKVDESVSAEGYRQYEYIKDELPDLFAMADVVLSRSGANAIFEFLALAKPALLVPLPLSASRGDQILNANYFVKRGYAEMLDQDGATADSLYEAVAKLYENRLSYHARMIQDAMLDGTDEVLREIRAAAGVPEAEADAAELEPDEVLADTTADDVAADAPIDGEDGEDTEETGAE